MSSAVAIAFAALLFAGGAFGLAQAEGGRLALLWGLGAALGATLFLAAFSFAGAFRRLLAEGRGAGVRAQLAMIALALCLFLPAIEAGTVFGEPVRGFVFPTGWALLLGAFLFGIGMQLGGGCGSGTLYTAAGGQGLRMWITLGAFIVGATLAAWDFARWGAWGALPAVSLAELWGTGLALAASLGVLGAAWAASRAIERIRHGAVEPIAGRLLWGGLALALLNAATLVAAGRPWAITAALPLWGSRAVEVLGWDDPAFWAFWEDPTRIEALLRPILADRTSVMDLGLMAGAFLAAAVSRRGADWRLPPPSAALASVLGGLLLGVGAVLASGCNISAFFGGIASGSLHGWVWIIPALIGNAVGLRLRPIFKLGVVSRN